MENEDFEEIPNIHKKWKGPYWAPFSVVDTTRDPKARDFVGSPSAPPSTERAPYHGVKGLAPIERRVKHAVKDGYDRAERMVKVIAHKAIAGGADIQSVQMMVARALEHAARAGLHGRRADGVNRFVSGVKGSYRHNGKAVLRTQSAIHQFEAKHAELAHFSRVKNMFLKGGKHWIRFQSSRKAKRFLRALVYQASLIADAGEYAFASSLLLSFT